MESTTLASRLLSVFAHFSLRRRLLLLIAVVVSILMVVITTLIFSQVVTKLRDSLVRDGDHELKSLAVSLAEPAALRDYPTIKQLLLNRFSQGDLKVLQYHYRGISINPPPKAAATARPDWFAAFLNIKPPLQQAEIELGGISYGTLELVNDSTSYEELIWKSFTLAALIMVAGLVLLLFAVGWVLKSNLLGLFSIRKSSVAIMEGHYGAKVELPEFAPPELEETAEALNEMGLKLGEMMNDLKAAEERWSFALEGAGDGVWDWNIATGTVEFSKKWKAIIGYSENELANSLEEFDQRIHPDDRGRLYAMLQDYFGRKVPDYAVETRLQCKDGSYKWILARGMVVKWDADGKPLRMVGTHTDIHARKLLEEQIKDERDFSNGILNTAKSLIMVIGRDGTVSRINREAEEFTGYAFDDMKGQPFFWERFLLAEQRPAVKEVFSKLVSGKDLLRYENYWVRRDGSKKLFEWSNSLLRDPDGQVEYVVTVGIDITERKLVEEALSKAKESAELLARSKAEFLANMSHEIRTPMNGIIGLSTLALNQPTSPEVRDYLEKISSSSQSLLGILNDILDFSKIEAGRLTIENAQFDLNTVIDNLRSMFEERAHSKHIEFDIHVADGIPLNLVGDALRLQQILSNLLGNAIKFTSRGHVSLSVGIMQMESSQALLRFAVEDTGIGISEEDQSKLFKSFSQVDGSITRKFGGTGLGLAISRELLELMGGAFNVESKPGQGTIFSFELLLGLASHGNSRAARQRDRHEPGNLEQALQNSAKTLKGARILVAEDNTINQQVVKEFLKLSGIEVTIVNNGQEALDQLETKPFDAILMDMHMPVMDGVEATRRIRANQSYAELPIIALTAGVTQEEQGTCMAAGMNDFVTKPVNPKSLLASLTNWVKKTG